jgi:hypothetical protein
VLRITDDKDMAGFSSSKLKGKQRTKEKGETSPLRRFCYENQLDKQIITNKQKKSKMKIPIIKQI